MEFWLLPLIMILYEFYAETYRNRGGGPTPYFSIASDASNHGSSRMFPVAIKFRRPQDGMKN
jgi:hypothetical protein